MIHHGKTTQHGSYPYDDDDLLLSEQWVLLNVSAGHRPLSETGNDN
jgi:hypothetical protein